MTSVIDKMFEGDGWLRRVDRRLAAVAFQMARSIVRLVELANGDFGLLGMESGGGEKANL